jgi:hypothetical protein
MAGMYPTCIGISHTTFFWLTCIVQGVKKRLQNGNASSAQAEETVARLMPLAEAAWAQARLAGA